jgi:hypothetical protein
MTPLMADYSEEQALTKSISLRLSTRAISGVISHPAHDQEATQPRPAHLEHLGELLLLA